MEWQPIETAPKDGSQFLATDGTLFGVGYHYRREEPPTIRDSTEWRRYYDHVMADAERQGMGVMERFTARNEAWNRAKAEAPRQPEIPNPKAGHVEEWDYASAFHAFDGETETETYDGPVGFTPTHWMPMPFRPAPEARRAETENTGSVHEGAGRNGIAQEHP